MTTEHHDKYSQTPLQRGLVYHGITYVTAITVAESQSDIRITTDTGELWEDLVKIYPVMLALHCM